MSIQPKRMATQADRRAINSPMRNSIEQMRGYDDAVNGKDFDNSAGSAYLVGWRQGQRQLAMWAQLNIGSK